MGVYHFMGLGIAVGAVTCAVDYIEKALDQIEEQKANDEIRKLFYGSGGINHEELSRGKIEALVLFTSREVINNEIKAIPYSGCDQPGMVREELERNLRQCWKRKDADKGRRIYWCEVEINNYEDCFNKILKAAYRFHPRGKQGKEIWCNLTGGTNSIGFALLSVARFTAFSVKHYLLSQSEAYKNEVRVPPEISIAPNIDGYFYTMPYISTHVDMLEMYEILMDLELHSNAGMSTYEVFSRMKGKGFFPMLSEQEFIRDYMLKLYGLGYTTYEPDTHICRITEAGRRFLSELENLEKMLGLERMLQDKHEQIVEESKTWEWFQVSNLDEA